MTAKLESLTTCVMMVAAENPRFTAETTTRVANRNVRRNVPANDWSGGKRRPSRVHLNIYIFIYFE